MHAQLVPTHLHFKLPLHVFELQSPLLVQRPPHDAAWAASGTLRVVTSAPAATAVPTAAVLCSSRRRDIAKPRGSTIRSSCLSSASACSVCDSSTGSCRRAAAPAASSDGERRPSESSKTAAAIGLRACACLALPS